MIHYKSPICIKSENAFKIEQHIRIVGKNKGAVYDEEQKAYQIKDKIKLYVAGEKYTCIEYHFHVPGEHIVDGKKYPAELHIVFVKDGTFGDDIEYLVIAKLIENSNNICNLEKIKINTGEYFVYDGLLTTEDESLTEPVRWIINLYPININISEIFTIARENLAIQNYDNRVLLFSENKCDCW